MFSEPILECLRVPGGEADASFGLEEDALVDPASGQRIPFIDGIPNLYVKPGGDGAGIDTAVHAFYEEHPFPNYEGLEDFGEIVNKGQHNDFLMKLLDAIGYNKLVLECGCGTGQMSHFLQLNNNHVLGIDASLSSLALAVEHKKRNNLTRSNFCRMNIFDLAIKDESFDVVISHGVLHHTHAAREAFREIVRKVKPGGLIVVGLYNYYARIPTWIRSKLIGIFGGRIDYVVRNHIRVEEKARIWLADQYFNPHETWHSIDEVQEWFDECGIDYLNCSPPILGTDGETSTSIAEPTEAGTRYQRIVTQISWLATISREGALFDVIGRRR